ncbi:hypothetical protein JKF63_07069 [Porcisia hertigi]|uniref:Uncharacterized protein n=1 Tax=Porcisia hertigi TaxID=2761500 RepID=A0A836LGL5_9TRYP|nr:hypothetical protein JKF63_07069 [Porcisia hertigi]
MGVGRRSDASKKQTSGSPSTAREPLIIAAAFLEGVVCVSGVPVMMAQMKYVSFPSSAHLFAYQLCFLVPQLVSTLVVEELTLYVSSSLLLFLTLVCSTGSAAIASLGLSQRALSLMFASRLLNGVFKHDKTLFGVTAKTFYMPTSSIGTMTRYGMIAGMLLSGIAADVLNQAVHVANLFIAVQALAAALVLARVLFGNRTPVVSARTSLQYIPWLLRLTRAPAAVYRAVATLVAVMLAASVNQVVYPIVAPSYDLPYSFAGAHLGFNLLLQLVLMPYVVAVAQRMARRWTPNLFLRGSADENLTVVAGLMLLAGCIFVPYAADQGPLVFYPTSLLLVDIPAGALISLTVIAVHAALGKSSADAPKVERFLGHITQVVKMFAAPIRICMSENFASGKHPVRYISVPLVMYALVYARTRSVAYALTALATTLLFLTHTVFSFEGEL